MKKPKSKRHVKSLCNCWHCSGDQHVVKYKKIREKTNYDEAVHDHN